MKTALVFLLMGIIALAVLYATSNVVVTETTVDLHLYDNYINVDRSSLIIIIVLFLGILFTLGGIFGTGFRNKFFLFLFLIFAGITGYFVMRFFDVIT